MTSNQLTYWRNEEDKRAHRVGEAENKRHNRETERAKIEELALKQIDQQLQSRSLDQKDKELVLKFAAEAAKYGYTAMEQLPQETIEKYPELFMTDGDKNQFTGVVHTIFKELKDWAGIGAKAGKALF